LLQLWVLLWVLLERGLPILLERGLPVLLERGLLVGCLPSVGVLVLILVEELTHFED